MNQERREKKNVSLSGFDGCEAAVIETIYFAETVDHLCSKETVLMAAGNDFERSQLDVNVRQRNPDDDRVKRTLHASPVLMRKHAPVHFFFCQEPAVEIEHRSRTNIGELKAELFSQNLFYPLV